MALCDDLRQNFRYVKNNDVTCWIEDMDYFIRECTNPALTALSKNIACPVGLPASLPQLSLPLDDEVSFDTWFRSFLYSERG